MEMKVDIGGTTTELAVLLFGGVVTARSLDVAGRAFDRAIVWHLDRAHGLQIGGRTAERIKLEIGSLADEGRDASTVVTGRDVVLRVPRRVTVTSPEIREAMREPFGVIVRAIKEMLQELPDELSADLARQGMLLEGGGSLLPGAARMIHEQTGIPVRFSPACAARGIDFAVGVSCHHP
jgi:rod shape-determining protein MreB